MGNEQSNMDLSLRRSAAVAQFMASQGLNLQRVRQEGRGERELLVRTADGVNENRNRRVDIVIKALVQGQEQAAWTPPGYLGG